MNRDFAIEIGLAMALCAVLWSGCGSGQSVQPESAPSVPGPTTTSASTELEKAMLELAPADRQLAESQKICPVSNEALGSMGTPIKVTVDGRDIFVCCEGCVEEIKSNFSQYAAKVDAPK